MLAARRLFSTSARIMANLKQRGVYYESHGDPKSVLSAITLPALQQPSASGINIKVLLAPINPSDINAVQGVYPLKPSPTEVDGKTVYIPGNEGLGEVQDVGPDVKGLSKGDWVIFAKKQPGTWRSGLSLNEQDVIKVEKAEGLTDVHAATLAVCVSFVHSSSYN